MARRSPAVIAARHLEAFREGLFAGTAGAVSQVSSGEGGAAVEGRHKGRKDSEGSEGLMVSEGLMAREKDDVVLGHADGVEEGKGLAEEQPVGGAEGLAAFEAAQQEVERGELGELDDDELVATSAAGGAAGDLRDAEGFAEVAEAVRFSSLEEDTGESAPTPRCECSRCCRGGWLGVCRRPAGADVEGRRRQAESDFTCEELTVEPPLVWSALRGKYIRRGEAEQCQQS